MFISFNKSSSQFPCKFFLQNIIDDSHLPDIRDSSLFLTIDDKKFCPFEKLEY